MDEYIYVLANLDEALHHLPILAKYSVRDVGDRIPVVFAMYAKYREAKLSFTPSGKLTGYSEDSPEKDPLLKELQIMALESLQNEETAKDFYELWVSLQSVFFGDFVDFFPNIMCTYLVSGSVVDGYAQASTSVMSEVCRILDGMGAKTIYEISGKGGLLGDEYEKWNSYSAYIPDTRERFVDGFVRELNRNRPITYVDKNIFCPNHRSLSIKSFDAIVANYSVQGGLCRNDDRYESIGRFVDDVIWYYCTRPDMDLRKAVLVVDVDFCSDSVWRTWRNKLVFFRLVESVTIVTGDESAWAVISLDMRERHDYISFKEIKAVNEDDGVGGATSFDMPVSIVSQEGYSLLPGSYRRTGSPSEDYWVSLVGSPFSNKDKEYLKRNHILISAETDTVCDDETGLVRLLKDDAVRPVKNIHAVIIDAKAEYDDNHPFKYGGIFNAAATSSIDVPVFIYSDISKDQIGKPLCLLLEKQKDHIIYVEGKNQEALASLVSSLRKWLGNVPRYDAAVIRKYSDEIAAADWLDESGEVTRIIASFMIEDVADKEFARNAEDLITNLRICAEKIFFGDRAHSQGIFPPLSTPGEILQFLSDGEFYDRRSGRFYVVNESDMMPAALRASLKYFIEMTNGASHAEKENDIDVRGYMSSSGRSGVYRACCLILLDLLVWFRNECQGPAGKRFSVKPILDDRDTVQMFRPKDYYYIGRVHLVNKPGLREGIPANRIKLKTVGREKNPAGEKVNVRYYSSDYEIISG